MKYLIFRIRGWIPKEYQVTLAHNIPKPVWWKPLWIAVLLLSVASAVVSYFVFGIPVDRVVLGIFLTCFCIGIAYYIRVRPSIQVNRALYILLGITPLGFSIWMAFALSGLGRQLTNAIGALPSLLIGWAVCLSVGAVIGNWIGRRRGYRLPLTP
ncbi:MAG: hypothetical protein NWF00_01850 [Candidatus Bathyarchaeota archaeon]|nr:hypothetical protein [Candidatus Bathyarchaeota archaeon]